MEPNTVAPFFTAELGKEIARSALVSAATVIAVAGGLFAVATVINVVKNIKDKKNLQPTAQ